MPLILPDAPFTLFSIRNTVQFGQLLLFCLLVFQLVGYVCGLVLGCALLILRSYRNWHGLLLLASLMGAPLFTDLLTSEPENLQFLFMIYLGTISTSCVGFFALKLAGFEVGPKVNSPLSLLSSAGPAQSSLEPSSP